MGISAKSKFVLCSESTNGHGWLDPNEIAVGLDIMTLEVLIHEINEVELQDLFVRLGLDPDAKVLHDEDKLIKFKGDILEYFWTGKVDGLIHLLSPFGENCLIYSTNDLTYWRTTLI